MKLRKVVWATVCIIGVACFLQAGPARAGFVGTVDVDLPDPGEGQQGPPDWVIGPPSFVFELVPGDASRGLLTLGEVFGGEGDLPVAISGLTDGDPIMSVTKEVENDSEFTWRSYLITMPDGGDITFTGTATSDRMTLYSSSAYELAFNEPDAIADGETVSFSFDVLIPSTGPFNFTLTQTPRSDPVPEPATLALLGVGAFFLPLRRRRK